MSEISTSESLTELYLLFDVWVPKATLLINNTSVEVCS